mmetsp:Transcript_10667/g.12189  ORF Transcript_10667/g.12189 Transcript_10667/m.12189 type:complete len:106 (+) Transcript_10667:986-1303(+)
MKFNLFLNNPMQILIGNKCDVDPSEIAVKSEEGKKLADDYGIQFFETSAKQNLKVTDAFQAIAQDVMTRLAAENGPNGPKQAQPQGTGVNINQVSKESNRGCACN